MEKKRKGFTLVEILVVVLVIVLISSFVVPRLYKGLGKTKRDIARSKMAIIEDSLGRFYLDCGRLPSQEEGLGSLLMMPAELEGRWAGPYIKQSQLLDPWGRDYIYIEEGEINMGSYDLLSLGGDGAEGGEGENEDIIND